MFRVGKVYSNGPTHHSFSSYNKLILQGISLKFVANVKQLKVSNPLVSVSYEYLISNRVEPSALLGRIGY